MTHQRSPSADVAPRRQAVIAEPAQNAQTPTPRGCPMYKHILIPTDGSEISQKSALQAINLAKLLGAKVTAVTVTAPWSAIASTRRPVIRPSFAQISLRMM